MKRFLRHIAPYVLLATYLPMVLLSSQHVHHDTKDTLDACGRCVGHIESYHHHDNDCLYCHILGQTYLGENVVPSDVVLPTSDSCPTEIMDRVATTTYGVAQLRAPPTV